MWSRDSAFYLEGKPQFSCIIYSSSVSPRPPVFLTALLRRTRSTEDPGLHGCHAFFLIFFMHFPERKNGKEKNVIHITFTSSKQNYYDIFNICVCMFMDICTLHIYGCLRFCFIHCSILWFYSLYVSWSSLIVGCLLWS